jgi:tRNA N6-adenosine threonylcarbamoyltransferase
VPELASREHLRNIVPVVREALERAGLSLNDVDAIGVTRGPGLVGSLLVGVTYGKALALSLGKPLIGVNHLEGHVRAVLLEAYRAGCQPKLPAVCLVVSGGHTVIYGVSAAPNGIDAGNADAGVIDAGDIDAGAGMVFSYRRIGQTRDDAAGEAYDKVARLLALGYPGGPVIDQLAAAGAKAAGAGGGSGSALTRYGIRFGPVKIKGNPCDFSFSGIKTAVLYYLRAHAELEPEIDARRKALERGERRAAQLLPLCSPQTLEILASFQSAVVAELVNRTILAARDASAEVIFVSGGVAANAELRATFEREAERNGFAVYFPSRELSTDNAAMIAAAAYPKFVAHELADASLEVEPVLPLA